MTPAAAVGIGAVRVYQWTVRPIIGPHCRFWPSCSEYAVEALQRHGAVKGSAMAARRILRCNPWHAGGYDPVPGTDTLPLVDAPADDRVRDGGLQDGQTGH